MLLLFLPLFLFTLMCATATLAIYSTLFTRMDGGTSWIGRCLWWYGAALLVVGMVAAPFSLALFGVFLLQ